MRTPHVDDHVRLTRDVPLLALHRGDVGVVRSTLFSPSVAYDVEFHLIGCDLDTRAILTAEQVVVDDGPWTEPPN